MKVKTIVYNRDIIRNGSVDAVIGVVFFALATALSAYVRIPLPGNPVPITLQTMFVLLAGAVLGRKLGGLSQIGYILLGCLGLPVFQGAAFGFAHIFGPTGGYLFGFVAAAYLMGALIGKKARSTASIALCFAGASLLILVCGAAWLAILFRMSALQAVSVGILPFIPGDIVKIALATAIYAVISGRSKEIFPA